MYNLALRSTRLHLLEGLYVIIDTDLIEYPLEAIIDILNDTPINIVQYRNKSSSKRRIYEAAGQIRRKLNSDKLLVINDRIDIGLDVADGVHIGQEDYPLERIRHICPDNFIIGVSCHSLKQARIAAQYAPSYIAMGCIFETKSKDSTTPVAIRELALTCNELSLPVCAIGGITISNLDQVLVTGIKMAAVISSVWKMTEPLEVIKMMHAKFATKDEYFDPSFLPRDCPF